MTSILDIMRNELYYIGTIKFVKLSSIHDIMLNEFHYTGTIKHVKFESWNNKPNAIFQLYDKHTYSI